MDIHSSAYLDNLFQLYTGNTITNSYAYISTFNPIAILPNFWNRLYAYVSLSDA